MENNQKSSLEIEVRKGGEEMKEKDWENIHKNFTEELQKEWEERGFNYEECKEWIDAGLQISDADYALWLIKKKSWDDNNFTALLWAKDKFDKLRKEYSESKKDAISLENTKKLLKSIENDTNKFLKKWGKRKDLTRFLSPTYYCYSLMIEIHNCLYPKNKYNSLSWLDKLRFYKLIDDKEHTTKYFINAIRMVNGAVWVNAGVKALQGDELMSKWELIIAPPVEVILSRIEWYIDVRNEKRDEFITESRHLFNIFNASSKRQVVVKNNSDNSNLGAYEKIDELNEDLGELYKKVKKLLKDYDIVKDNEINELERVIARRKFADDLLEESEKKNEKETKWKQIKEIDKIIKDILSKLEESEHEWWEKIFQINWLLSLEKDVSGKENNNRKTKTGQETKEDHQSIEFEEKDAELIAQQQVLTK